MLYRNSNGSYTASSSDGEHRKQLTKEEGERMIRRLTPPKWWGKLIRDRRPGFVIT